MYGACGGPLCHVWGPVENPPWIGCCARASPATVAARARVDVKARSSVREQGDIETSGGTVPIYLPRLPAGPHFRRSARPGGFLVSHTSSLSLPGCVPRTGRL